MTTKTKVKSIGVEMVFTNPNGVTQTVKMFTRLQNKPEIANSIKAIENGSQTISTMNFTIKTIEHVELTAAQLYEQNFDKLNYIAKQSTSEFTEEDWKRGYENYSTEDMYTPINGKMSLWEFIKLCTTDLVTGVQNFFEEDTKQHGRKDKGYVFSKLEKCIKSGTITLERIYELATSNEYRWTESDGSSRTWYDGIGRILNTVRTPEFN